MSNRNWKVKGVPRVLLAMLMCATSTAWSADATEEDTVGTGDQGTTVTGDAPTLENIGTTASPSTATAAGSTIVNDALLDFTVGGVAQDTIDVESSPTARSVFLVDRRIDVNVTRVPGTKDGTPNGVASLLFDVTNQTNDDSTNLYLEALNIAANLAPLAGAEIIATPTPAVTQICLDGDGDDVCDAGEELATEAGNGYLLPVADSLPGTTQRIIVEVSVPGAAVLGEWDTFRLAAAVGDGAGTRYTNDDNGNQSPGAGASSDIPDAAGTVENVFADAASASGDGVNFTGPAAATDVASDGQHSAEDQFRVNAADMTVVKSSTVIYDPVNGFGFNLAEAFGSSTGFDITTPIAGVNPKRIPGAIVRYVVEAQNDADDNDEPAAAAASVTISDVLPTALDAGDTANAAAGVSANLNFVITEPCSGSASETAIGTTPPVTVTGNLGTCSDTASNPGDAGRIIYFMTIP